VEVAPEHAERPHSAVGVLETAAELGTAGNACACEACRQSENSRLPATWSLGIATGHYCQCWFTAATTRTRAQKQQHQSFVSELPTHPHAHGTCAGAGPGSCGPSRPASTTIARKKSSKRTRPQGVDSQSCTASQPTCPWCSRRSVGEREAQGRVIRVPLGQPGSCHKHSCHTYLPQGAHRVLAYTLPHQHSCQRLLRDSTLALRVHTAGTRACTSSTSHHNFTAQLAQVTAASLAELTSQTPFVSCPHEGSSSAAGPRPGTLCTKRGGSRPRPTRCSQRAHIGK
jgi:hypothetical protein